MAQIKNKGRAPYSFNVSNKDGLSKMMTVEAGATVDLPKGFTPMLTPMFNAALEGDISVIKGDDQEPEAPKESRAPKTEKKDEA